MKKILLIFTATLVLAGCDVENPGPIAEDSLNSPQAVPGIVVGMSSDFSLAYRVSTYWGSLWSDDLTHTGTYSAPTVFSTGEINSEDVDPWWGPSQRARWVAENGIERLQEILGDEFSENENAAKAYLYAGYSNRNLGENACYAVIDGGGQQDHTVFFERAEQHFTDAISLGENIGNTDIRNAGYAGRASVRAAMGEWSDAAADAEEVPLDYRFEAVYSLNSSRENNNWPPETLIRAEYGVYGTQWEGSDDPRLPQEVMYTADGDTATASNGRTPWIAPKKYETEADNIALSKGTEMLLIQAEAELRLNDDFDAAMDLINEGRAFHGLTDLSAASIEEAWEHLQNERGADMWLEGRRFWDLRRWYEEEGPAHHDFLEGRDKCVPIGQEELGMNTNL